MTAAAMATRPVATADLSTPVRIDGPKRKQRPTPPNQSNFPQPAHDSGPEPGPTARIRIRTRPSQCKLMDCRISKSMQSCSRTLFVEEFWL